MIDEATNMNTLAKDNVNEVKIDVGTVETVFIWNVGH